MASPRMNPVPKNQRRPGKSLTKAFSVQAGSHGRTDRTIPTQRQKITVAMRKKRCIHTGGGSWEAGGAGANAVADLGVRAPMRSSCSEESELS